MMQMKTACQQCSDLARQLQEAACEELRLYNEFFVDILFRSMLPRQQVCAGAQRHAHCNLYVITRGYACQEACSTLPETLTGAHQVDCDMICLAGRRTVMRSHCTARTSLNPALSASNPSDGLRSSCCRGVLPGDHNKDSLVTPRTQGRMTCMSFPYLTDVEFIADAVVAKAEAESAAAEGTGPRIDFEPAVRAHVGITNDRPMTMSQLAAQNVAKVLREAGL